MPLFSRIFLGGMGGGGKQFGFPPFDMEALVMAFGDLLDETRSTRQTVANRRGAGEKPFKLKFLGNKDGLWKGKPSLKLTPKALKING